MSTMLSEEFFTNEQIIDANFEAIKCKLNEQIRLSVTNLKAISDELGELCPVNDKECFVKLREKYNKIGFYLSMRSAIENYQDK